jgi:rod shape-determining protein MreB
LRLTAALGIDLGTSNTLVYRRGKGLVMNVPTVVAVDSNGRVLALGAEAREMIGRTPGDVQAVSPISEGVISRFQITYRFLEKIRLLHVGRSHLYLKPGVLISKPSGITNVEERALGKAARMAGFDPRSVHLVEEPFAAAIGAGLPVEAPTGHMVVDLGGGTTDISVMSLGGIVRSESIRIGGKALDEAIIKHLRTHYQMHVSESAAESLKISIGSAYRMDEEADMEVRGRDLLGGLPVTRTISSEEVREALREPVKQITDRIQNVLESIAPELGADIIETGILLTGGTALLRGLDELIGQITGIRTEVAANPLDAVAVGLGRMLDNPQTMRRFA